MKDHRKTVFVVENNKLERSLIKEHFKGNHKYSFKYFTKSGECFAALGEHPLAVLVDYDLNTIDPNEKDGVIILNKIKQLDHHTEVVFYSNHENTEMAVSTIKHGAFDYIVLNEYRFHRLENELKSIEAYSFHKTQSSKYKFLFRLTLSVIIFWILVVSVLFFTGILRPGPNVWLEP